jgi:hypothetical protein
MLELLRATKIFPHINIEGKNLRNMRRALYWLFCAYTVHNIWFMKMKLVTCSDDGTLYFNDNDMTAPNLMFHFTIQ